MYHGRAYYFESHENRDAFEGDAKKYLAASPVVGQAIGAKGRPAISRGGTDANYYYGAVPIERFHGELMSISLIFPRPHSNPRQSRKCWRAGNSSPAEDDIDKCDRTSFVGATESRGQLFRIDQNQTRSPVTNRTCPGSLPSALA